MTTEDFIKQFACCDVRDLALKAARYPDVDIHYALNQIAGRQAARYKLPAWAATEGLIYPPHLSMEQCSSESTALYKRRLLQRITNGVYTLADLTGGFGVDFMYMSEGCRHAVYVEHNSELCETAAHNARVLNRDNVEIVNAESEEFVNTMPDVSVIYIDPARRDANGGRTYAISDCTPDVLNLLPVMLEKARYVVVKLSPMLDHNKAVEDLNSVCRCVSEVHVVSSGNECKELLLVLTHDVTGGYRMYCVNDNQTFSFEQHGIYKSPTVFNEGEFTDLYLYEPNASIMKAGCFTQVGEAYEMPVVAVNSNLYVSHEKIKDFPGRTFRIVKQTSMNKKELAAALSGMKRANITVRNFPVSVPVLRKRLKLSEGGDVYIFATTTSSGAHTLLICEKLNK